MHLIGEHAPKLDSYTKDEWRSVVKHLNPDYPEAQFDADWDRFLALKAERSTCRGTS